VEFHWRNWNQRRDDHGKLQRGESIKPYAHSNSLKSKIAPAGLLQAVVPGTLLGPRIGGNFHVAFGSVIPGQNFNMSGVSAHFGGCVCP
jgi:hypothetical protein